MKYTLLFLTFGVFCGTLAAQNDSIQVLDEVVLHGSKLETYSNTQHLRVLSDSLMEKSSPLLTDILNFNTPIYFKENGPGMVASVAFRGTTASQTAVVWNGININSKLNGQTDFNAINIAGFDKISVRNGGGSVLYGTGAIGGSVHLTNKLRFENDFQNRLQLSYGSFNTLDARYELSASNEKTSVQVNVARTQSDNDFPYPDSDRKNLNGQYYNTSIKSNFAYKINPDHVLEFHSAVFEGERHFSLIRPTENRTKYQNFHAWNLLEWKANFGAFTSGLKLAYLTENFKYFENIERDFHTGGETETFVTKYDIGTEFKNNFKLNALFDFSTTKGKGANIPENSQQKGAVALLAKQRLSERFLYELGAKKEFTDTYESPFLFSGGLVFDAADFYSIKLNVSKNYRIPTFNDLYWEQSGNLELQPETSHQYEIGNYFRLGSFEFSATAFLIDIDDMIRWIPAANGIWKATNTEKVRSYGLESILAYRKSVQKHQFSFHASYGYTVSENENTGRQLIYVPFHKATVALGYRYENFGLRYSFLFNGKVFTRTDNDERYNIPAYEVSNLHVSYRFGKKYRYKIRGSVKNLFNEKYQTVENRYFPGRNFMLSLIFKI